MTSFNMKNILFLLMNLLTVHIALGVNCSKRFLTQSLEITCTKQTSEDGEPKLVIAQFNADITMTTPERTCTTTNNTITCQQLISIGNLGIGQHNLTVRLYSTSGQAYSYTTSIAITLDYPQIILKHCDYDENNTVHCMCDRIDTSEMETWIYIYSNGYEQNKTSSKSLQAVLVLHEPTMVKCVAENMAGWRSSSANIFFSTPPEKATNYRNYVKVTLSIFFVAVCVVYYKFRGRNMINTATRLPPLLKTTPFYNEWNVSENNIEVNTVVEDETPSQQSGSILNVKDNRHEEDLKEDKTLNKDCINKGTYTLQSKLHIHVANCQKNPGHEKFVPVNQISLEHFPSGYHDNDVYDLTKAMADLTVRIAVKFTSPDRPEFVPDTKDPYPCYNTRGQNSLKTGTGRVWMVDKYTEGMDQMKRTYRPCPCPECDHSDTPSKVWWQVEVLTARHVVFDSSEARQSSCRLWFDDDQSPVVKIYGWRVRGSNTEGDLCRLYCVTHDVAVAGKLEEMVWRFNGLCDKVRDKYWSRRDVDKLTIIVSHPHGCSKQVSVGYWVDRQVVRDDRWTRYTYTTCTCPGSAGASVYRLGWGRSNHIHSGSYSGGLNYSGVAFEHVL